MTEFIGGKTYHNSEIYTPTDSIRLYNYPTISIATLYNYFEKKSNNCCHDTPNPTPISSYCSSNNIVLNVNSLEEDEFFNLFYKNTTKYFCVNRGLVSNNNILFLEQYYISNDSEINHFSLYNEVLKCFEENYNVSVNNINPSSLISLQKEVYKTQSLATVCGTQISLSWDQVINSLISNGQIEHSSRNNCAPIIFQINFRFYSCALNVYLNITFQYKVHISGYSLKNKCIDSSSSESSSSCESSSSSSYCSSSTSCESSSSCSSSTSCDSSTTCDPSSSSCCDSSSSSCCDSSCNCCGESSSNCCCDSSSCTSESISSSSSDGCNK